MVFENSIVLTTVADFIDYALAVVAALAVIYLVRFLFAVRETTAPDRAKRDAEWEAKGAAGREWLSEKAKKMKEAATAEEERRKGKKEAADRARLLHGAQGFITRAEQNSENVRDELRHQTAAALTHARDRINQVHQNLRSARRVIHAAKAHCHGDRRNYMSQLQAYIEAIEQLVHDTILPGLPSNHTAADWTTKVRGASTQLQNVEARCGVLFNSIHNFIENDQMNLPGVPPAPPRS